jgi:hypothetical protein
LRLEHAHGLFPEQAVQDRLGLERQQLVARQRGGQDRDAVVGLAQADVVFIATAAQVALALHGQALDQQARRHAHPEGPIARRLMRSSATGPYR